MSKDNLEYVIRCGECHAEETITGPTYDEAIEEAKLIGWGFSGTKEVHASVPGQPEAGRRRGLLGTILCPEHEQARIATEGAELERHRKFMSEATEARRKDAVEYVGEHVDGLALTLEEASYAGWFSAEDWEDILDKLEDMAAHARRGARGA